MSVTALATGPRDLPARQQTLRDTLAWSVALLEPDEQRSLASLSVFSGGCSLDAASCVAGADLDRLAALADHSLLHRDPAGEEPRFRMLETVREFAAEQLRDRRPELHHLHAVYFTDLAENADLRGADQQRWLERLDRERDNLRAALDHANVSPDPVLELRLATALWRFWWVRGELGEGRMRLERAIARGDHADPSLVAQACVGAAGIAWSQGDPMRARELANEGLRLTASADDDATTLSCHTVLGLIARDARDFALAREHLEQSALISSALGRESDVNVAKMNLGSVAFDSGDYATAVPLWQAVLAYNRERNAEEGTAIALLNLGLAAYWLDQPGEAGRQFAEAEMLFDRMGFREYHVHALHGLAAVAAVEGRGEPAAGLLGRAARCSRKRDRRVLRSMSPLPATPNRRPASCSATTPSRRRSRPAAAAAAEGSLSSGTRPRRASRSPPGHTRGNTWLSWDRRRHNLSWRRRIARPDTSFAVGRADCTGQRVEGECNPRRHRASRRDSRFHHSSSAR